MGEGLGKPVMRFLLRVGDSAVIASLVVGAVAAESGASSRAPIVLSKSAAVSSPASPGAAPGDAPGGLESALGVLKQAVGLAEGAQVFEGLPHPFEKEALEAEKRKPTVRFDGEWFYEKPAALETSSRLAVEKALLGSSLTPFRGLKLCGGFHADYAVRWTSDDGRRATLALVCFGCGEARIIADDGRRWTADLSAEGVKELRTFFATYRRERPAPDFKTAATPPARQ